jgi:hypothetical protein
VLGKTLLYIPSGRVVDYIARNPIDWDDRELAKRGGAGDQAGVPPTPTVEEFFGLLLDKQGLFTQRQYWEHCWRKWNGWIKEKPEQQQRGVKAKLYRNFYPSYIDSLHVWSILCESGEFDQCVLNSTEDAVGKTDITVRRGDRVYRIAIVGPTDHAVNDRAYKVAYRGDGETVAHVVLQMPIAYEKNPGNKRWFRSPNVMDAILCTDKYEVVDLAK